MRARSERGLAMVAVLLVLMALFVLSAPFLLTVRNADRASAQQADRVSARVALDSAARHARGRLAASHPGLDRTPTFDSEEEIELSNDFPEGFLDASDPNGVMWDLEVEDMAGRIDLNSASPHVLANLIGGVARLTAQVSDSARELPVASTDGFLPAGFAWIGDGATLELVGYSERGRASLGGLTRGLGVTSDAEGNALACGPSAPSGYEVGTYAIDQRAYAFARWRIATGGGAELGRFDTLEQAVDAEFFTVADELGEGVYETLARTATVHGGVRAGQVWQRGARLTAEVRGLPEPGCILPLDDTRHFNAGTTVLITDGITTELGIVRASNRDAIRLMEPLQGEYFPLTVVVRPLARRPVNVNTASPEVLRALFVNLKLRTSSARITRGEANDLVELVVASRPFTGLEDFVRRVVLPAAGFEPLPADAPVEPDVLARLEGLGETQEDGTRQAVGFIDEDDARALYKNALNANDGELEFSTMPLAFTTRDVYRLELRAAVNAASGAERSRAVREDVVLVAPQDPILVVWARQESFEEGPRFDREAPGWLSGPEATSRHDRVFGSRWPPRSRAHLGRYDTFQPIDPPPDPDAEATLVFPDREEDAWIQLAPARTDDEGTRNGRVVHFDDETRGLEGRYLPDGVVEYDPNARPVRWTASGGFLEPLSVSMWIQPRELREGAVFMDLGGGFTDSDRVTLLIEEGDLVLRVLDAAGDHPDSVFEERSEVRYSISGAGGGAGAGAGPGLPADTWTHVEVGVAGNRPSQTRLLVDGRASAERPGLTRLTSSIGDSTQQIPVESTEGFPDRCAVRIGDEIIEVLKQGETGFLAAYDAVGTNAGFGGRLARELFQGVWPQEVNQGLSKDTAHEAGATVELYGYSLPLFSNVPANAGGLGGDLGPFAVARVTGIVRGTKEDFEEGMEPIKVTARSGGSVTVGHGMDGFGNDVNALVLESADTGRDISEVMRAFSTTGGYAAILSKRWTFQVEDPQTGATSTHDADQTGVRLGGVEVIRYSGVQGNHLRIAGRGDAVTFLANLAGGDDDVVGRGAFVFHHVSALESRNERLTDQVMVVPISIPVSGASSQFGFLPARAGASEFAQITHAGGDGHFTEWVRYDEIDSVAGQLVRDDPAVLRLASEAAHGGLFEDEPGEIISAPTGPGGRPGGLTPGGNRELSRLETSSARRPSRPAARGGPTQGVPTSFWYYALGEPQVELEDYPVTRAVASRLQFRGVLGTHSQAHPANTPVLPVFKLLDQDETAGRPGRFDHVMLFSGNAGEPGFPGVVAHAHRPFEYTVWGYSDGSDPLSAEADVAGENVPQDSFDTTSIHVALERSLAVPLTPTANPQNATDTRRLARMTLFPSGERPRQTSALTIGGDLRGGAVPSAVVDEIAFGTDVNDFQLVVDEDFGDGDEDLVVREVRRTTLGDVYTPQALSGLPRDAGLLRIGDEILCYDAYDAGTGVVHVPPQGRGLLGTEPQAHVPGTGVTFLESWRVTVLAADVGAADHSLPVISRADFPPEGTVLVDDELIHYTSLFGGALEMPRASEEPGAMDRRGAGIFRGRYGTDPAGHTGATPVIVFPFRYWDRWAEEADAPELAYYQFTIDQPDAYWLRAFWAGEEAPAPGPRLGVLQRARPEEAWDADPESSEALELTWDGDLEGDGNPIGVQSNRISWRVFVRHEPGSYDPRFGLAHGWKTTPRLVLFGAEYLAPNRTLTRIER